MKKYILTVSALFLIAAGSPGAANADPAAGPAFNAGSSDLSGLGVDKSEKKISFWRRKLNVGFFMMRQTPTGKACYAYGLENRLKPVWFNLGLTELYTVKDDVFLISAEIVPAWPDYIAWVLVQGFVRFRHNVILKEYGSPEVGNFVELDQWALLMAMRQWDERKASLENDHSTGIADRREAKVSLFHKAWKEDLAGFLKLAADRHGRLYADSTTMEEFLERPDLPRAARQAVLELNRQWRAVLAEESGRRPGETGLIRDMKPAAPGGPVTDSPVLNQFRSF